jgi:hypothetical protein
MRKSALFLFMTISLLLVPVNAFASEKVCSGTACYSYYSHQLSDGIGGDDFSNAEKVVCKVNASQYYFSEYAQIDVNISLKWYKPNGDRVQGPYIIYDYVYGSLAGITSVLDLEDSRQPGKWRVEHWAENTLLFTAYFTLPPPVGVCPGDYTIENSTDIEGLSGCTEITGRLIIYNTDLTSLTGLENLTSVGLLAIQNNSALTSLTGLENITTVGGKMEIYNTALTSLSALNNLTSVGGDFLISYNNALTSLNGLNNITSVGGYLTIGYNDALTSLHGLRKLTGTGEYLYIG